MPKAPTRRSRRREAGAPVPSVHAVILAGGAGQRFWPRSRRAYPKPLMQVVGGKTLLDAAMDRARRIAGEGKVWLVCGHEHAPAMRSASGLPRSRFLVEPDSGNTAMATAWAAQRIRSLDPDGVMVVLSADHHIPDADAFAKAIEIAARAAAQNDALVTLGVRPSRPEIGYGYIHVGRKVEGDLPGLHRIRRFVEKPDQARAARYLALGDYLWNAGIFVWSASTLLQEIEVCAPDLHRALAPLRRVGSARTRAPVESAYRRAPSVPIDVAVLERSRKVWTIPVEFAWSDVGTWSSLAEQLGMGSSQKGRPEGKPGVDDQGNCVIDGDVLSVESTRNLVWGGDRSIALFGVEDLAVIDTDDVILITKLDRSSDVRSVVSELKRKGRNDLT